MLRYSLIIIFSFLFSCEPESKDKEVNTSPKPEPITEEPKGIICDEWLDYEKKYNDTILVKSNYNTCEPEWKSDLELYINNEVIYTTPQLWEYQFNSYIFPTIIEDDSSVYILIERDCRPLINKMDVFKITNNTIDTIYSIPLFEKEGGDIDNDGIIEYADYLDAIEGMTPTMSAYNPIFVYELDENTLRFDTSATIELNKKIYGDFYGYKQDYSIMIDNDSINNNW